MHYTRSCDPIPDTHRFVLETEVSTPLGEIQSITWTKLILHVLLCRAVVECYVLSQQFICLVQLCTILGPTTTLKQQHDNMEAQQNPEAKG